MDFIKYLQLPQTFCKLSVLLGPIWPQVFQSFLTFWSPHQATTTCFDCLISQAYHDQTKIEWHNFLHRHLSISWHPAFQHAYKSSITCCPPVYLSRTIITATWQHSLDLWHFCNGDLYGHNFAEQWQIQLAYLRHRVDKHFDAFNLNPHHSSP